MTSKAKATELVAKDAQKDVRAGGMLTDRGGRPITDAGGRPVFASADGAEVLDSLGTPPLAPTTATGTDSPADPGTA